MFLDIAVECALAAGFIQKSYFRREFKIGQKGNCSNDLVTEVDMLCEKKIVEIINKAFPEHTILAEESGLHDNNSTCKWIIDPIDGTTNFVHSFPFFCSSIALEINGIVECGVVYNPISDELFTSQKGKGAFLNGKPILVSTTQFLNRSLVATGFPYSIMISENNNLDFFSKFSFKTHGIRRAGSAAIDLCYVAAGIFDGFWEMNLKPWDTAAASLILLEAGGRLSCFNGNAYSIYKDEVLASNCLIHEEMVKIFME